MAEILNHMICLFLPQHGLFCLRPSRESHWPSISQLPQTNSPAKYKQNNLLINTVFTILKGFDLSKSLFYIDYYNIVIYIKLNYSCESILYKPLKDWNDKSVTWLSPLN